MNTSSAPFSSPAPQPEPAADRTVPESPPTVHAQRSARADERVWLERLPDRAATMGLHAFCLDCGTVRSRLPRPGRSLSFFYNAIGALGSILEKHPECGKLAQVQGRLIAKAIETVPEFGDQYSMSYETQWAIFVKCVQRVRPDVEIDVIERALPRQPRRTTAAVVDVVVARKGLSSRSPKVKVVVDGSRYRTDSAGA